jgi:hypothetical protein
VEPLSYIGGGAIRSRTGLDGFAIRCITALLSRRAENRLNATKKKGKPRLPFGGSDRCGVRHRMTETSILERETRLELATSTLARLRSTN